MTMTMTINTERHLLVTTVPEPTIQEALPSSTAGHTHTKTYAAIRARPPHNIDDSNRACDGTTRFWRPADSSQYEITPTEGAAMHTCFFHIITINSARWVDWVRRAAPRTDRTVSAVGSFPTRSSNRARWVWVTRLTFEVEPTRFKMKVADRYLALQKRG